MRYGYALLSVVLYVFNQEVGVRLTPITAATRVPWRAAQIPILSETWNRFTKIPKHTQV